MRVYNFSAGPAVLPPTVLEKARDEIADFKGSGMSVMEMSHRTPIYENILNEAKNSLRRLMSIPENYEILFLQGGASLQFSMVPINLMKTKKADYVDSGVFAKKSYSEALLIGDAQIVASSADRGYKYVPKVDPSKLRKDASYLHITTNNTIYGTCSHDVPETNGLNLVADMSSNILSEVYDVEKFAMIYAGAQKNIGPAGVTVVIIRDDMIHDPVVDISSMLSYKKISEQNSMYNTPPTYGIYLAGLVFENLEKLGGVPVMQRKNEEKAAALYSALDASSFYQPFADTESRSTMNVTFFTPNPELDGAFCKQAAENGLVNLKGHRATGGIRASIYNAMDIEGVQALISFMREFERKNG